MIPIRGRTQPASTGFLVFLTWKIHQTMGCRSLEKNSQTNDDQVFLFVFLSIHSGSNEPIIFLSIHLGSNKPIIFLSIHSGSKEPIIFLCIHSLSKESIIEDSSLTALAQRKQNRISKGFRAYTKR